MTLQYSVDVRNAQQARVRSRVGPVAISWSYLAIWGDPVLPIHSGGPPPLPLWEKGWALNTSPEFFNDPVNGVLTLANPHRLSGAAYSTGTMTWFRFCYFSYDGTPLVQGSVGGPGSGADMIVANPVISTPGQVFTVLSCTLTNSNG